MKQRSTIDNPFTVSSKKYLAVSQKVKAMSDDQRDDLLIRYMLWEAPYFDTVVVDSRKLFDADLTLSCIEALTKRLNDESLDQNYSDDLCAMFRLLDQQSCKLRELMNKLIEH